MYGRRRCLSRLAALAASLGLAPSLTSCGAIIHPERIGQPPGGRLDPGVILLDGLGLLLFLIPGVIAFIVDFSTGAIYLPPNQSGSLNKPNPGLVRVPVDPNQLSRKRIERVVSETTGKPVRLERGSFSATPLKSVDDFDSHIAILEARGQKPAEDVVFRCQSE